MADQHDGALEFVERHRQRFARGQVEVVGRLVEQQQIGALPHDHGQHQARLFAAAHAAYGLLHHVAAEVEAAQEVAQILLTRVHAQRARQPHHVAQRVVVAVQYVQLLLCKVANRQALALGHLATQRRHHACDGFDQR